MNARMSGIYRSVVIVALYITRWARYSGITFTWSRREGKPDIKGELLEFAARDWALGMQMLANCTEISLFRLDLPGTGSSREEVLHLPSGRSSDRRTDQGRRQNPLSDRVYHYFG